MTLQSRPFSKHFTLSAFLFVALGALQVKAEPILQLYIEGSTYDTESESWVISPSGSSNGAPFTLWTIGNVSGGGGKGTIEDVKLSIVYEAAYAGLIVTLTPTTTGGLGGFVDPSVAAAPIHLQTNTTGDTPLLGDGSPLPSHDEYGSGMIWQEFALGDFSQNDSPIADFTDNFPTSMTMSAGQINAYEVTVSMMDGSSPHGAVIHFDLYNHVQAGNKTKYVFAPFSHDANGSGGVDVTSTIVPSPTAFMMGAILCAGLTLARPMRRILA